MAVQPANMMLTARCLGVWRPTRKFGGNSGDAEEEKDASRNRAIDEWKALPVGGMGHFGGHYYTRGRGECH